MASSVVLRRHINDITQCPICLELFDAPTSLPCLHTFCLRCLQRIFTDDRPGDVVTCPVCRREFQLPAGGLAALPRNFTIGGLVAMYSGLHKTRSTSAPASVIETETVEPPLDHSPCESIADAAQCIAETKEDMENVDESGVLAAEAISGNNTTGDGESMKCLTHLHKQLPSATSKEVVTASASINCDCGRHGAVEAEFCFDCKVDLCRSCSGDVHRKHRRRAASDVRAECRRRVAAELARVNDALSATCNAMKNVDQRREGLLKQLQQKETLARAECSAEDEGRKLKRLSKLLAERDDAMRQLAARKDVLDVDEMSLETFLRDEPRKLTNATTTADLLRVAKQVKMETDSLLSVHQTRLDGLNVDGKLQTVHTELVTTMSEADKPVCALTVLEDELYVVRSSSHIIEVFDVESFSPQRQLTTSSVQQRTLLSVMSLSHFSSSFTLTDMTSCRQHRCLYLAVVDHGTSMVQRLDGRTGHQVTQWAVQGTSSAVCLSVSTTFNVVVSCLDSLSVRLYTPLGCPVSEISVQRPQIVGLAHAVQLSCGSLVVIGVTESRSRLACIYRHSTDTPDVMVIDSSGCATHLSLVGGRASSQVWLAEQGPSAGVRIVQVSEPPCSVKLPTQELKEPDKMCWDDNARRLYVVDRGLIKVFRVHMKYDLC